MKKDIHKPFLALLATLLVAAPTLGMTQKEKDKFWSALEDRQTKIVRELLDDAGDNAIELITAPNKDGITPLHYATRSGNTERVKMILDSAGDNAIELINAPNKDRSTLLHYATRSGNIEMVKIILDSVSDRTIELITDADEPGHTPLYYAIHLGSGKMVKMILDSAGKKAIELMNTTCENGYTPLHYAVCYHNSNPDTIRVLIERGANPHLLDANGKTAKDLARCLPEIQQLLANWSELSFERRKLESKRDIARTRQFYHLRKNHPLASDAIKKKIGAFLTPEPRKVLREEKSIIHMPNPQRAQERRRLEAPDKLRTEFETVCRRNIEEQQMLERQQIKDALHALHRQ